MPDLLGHTSCVKSVVISSDGKRVVSGSSDKSIKVWNLETGEEIKTLKVHTEFV